MEKTMEQKIELMKDYKDGKKIEYKLQCESDDVYWYNDDCRVREPKYRPYENTEEMTEEQKKEIIRQFIDILSSANVTQNVCNGRTRVLINLDSKFSSELEMTLRLNKG